MNEVGVLAMFDAPYLKMICDSDYGDGGVYFYDEYFEWVGRRSRSGFKMFYKDIADVAILYGRKKRVTVSLRDGSVKHLYLYKADSLKMYIHQAVERVNGKNPEAKEPLAIENGNEAEDVVTKLERLAKLHESGALSDEEFERAKRKVIE